MAAELCAHRRQQTVGVVALAARAEAREQRGCQDRCGGAGLDRGQRGPAPFAGVGDLAGEALQRRILVQRRGGEIEQPAAHDGAAAPDLRDLRDVDLVEEVLGVAHRRGLGVMLDLGPSGAGVAQQVQPLGVGLHEPVLDAVVDHLHEVARPGRTAVEPALLLRRRLARAARRARRRVDARRERAQRRSQLRDSAGLAADHQPEPVLEAPDAAADAAVDVVHSALRGVAGAPQVIDVVRVAAVDDDVAGLQQRQQLGEHDAHDAGRDHHPDGARRR